MAAMHCCKRVSTRRLIALPRYRFQPRVSLVQATDMNSRRPQADVRPAAVPALRVVYPCEGANIALGRQPRTNMASVDSRDVIFRRRALERQAEQESIDALQKVTAPHEWIIAAALAVLLLACIAWGLLGRVELILQIEGVIVKAGERGVIVTALPGRIVDVPVKSGDTVPAGTTVAALEPASLEPQLRLATAREAALAEIAGATSADRSAVRNALGAAQTERVELEALRKSGSEVVTSRRAEITALLVGVGEAVDAGAPVARVRYAELGSPEAVAFLGPERARALRTGMPVRVRYQTGPGEEAAVLRGELSSVSEPAPLPPWLAAVPFEGKVASEPVGQLARFSIVDGNPSDFDDLAVVRLEVTLGRIAPIELLIYQ